VTKLRERAVYVLPDGKSYVAESSIFGSYNLYKVGGPTDVASYKVNGRGEVLDPVTLVVVFRPGSVADTGRNRAKRSPRRREKGLRV
jgi:hypothetical protein